jgi:26S proteasome regulatory subunit T1
MTPEVMTHFMDGTIRDRINIRLLAEEHIAISRALEEKGHVDDFLGVVHTKCSPAENIQLVGAFVTDLCEATLGASPRIRIDGHIDASFA